MKIDIIREPVFHLKINNVFGKDINKQIFDEAVKNEEYFKDAITIGNIGKDYRNNKALYYDELYKNKRNESKLLTNLSKLFGEMSVKEHLASAGFPLNQFANTNIHETQVSRYGNNEFYKWHLDTGVAPFKRVVTFVYHFFKEPKTFTGGELLLTNSIISEGVKREESMPTYTIKPENDTGYFFPSSTAHMVLPTTTSKAFEDGRFSVNCWIGMNVSRFVGRSVLNGQ